MTVNIRNCYTANSTVISVDGTGGIVGTAYRNINIENCYSTNTIISANNDKAAGGIAGGFNDAKDSYTIKNSIALNPSIASSKSAGRIIGWIKDSSKQRSPITTLLTECRWMVKLYPERLLIIMASTNLKKK